MHGPDGRVTGGLFLVAAAALVMFLPQVATAGVRLPLDGYCRPGRYFPVEISQAGVTHLTAEGALDTDIAETSDARTIVPMLVLGSPGDLRWAGGSLPLRVPGEHERLVASTSLAIDPATLFPGDRILPIHLDAADPLPGPPAAWGALDAVVLDSAAVARITDGRRSTLLAAGVTLAVPSPIRPDDRWPWRKSGASWVLAYAPPGPVDQLMNPDAYSPTFAWTPGPSPAVRGQIAAVAVLLFLTVVFLAMFRNRWAVAGMIAISLATTVVVVVWQQALGSVYRAGGDVIVQSPGLIQKDAWVFERAIRTRRQAVPWAGWTVPLFPSPQTARQTGMSISIAADGGASFDFELERGKTIAFVRRQVQPGSPPPTTAARTSPMRESGNAIYLGHGDRIVGETAGNADRWPGVVVVRHAE